MTQKTESLLKVFISSTFRDLQDERSRIFSRLEQSLNPVGMEFFIPDGKTSQEIALLNENNGLKNADCVIFLISPKYGSLLKKCTLTNICKADCPKKQDPDFPISYTHCEYKFALAEKKPFQIYFYDKKGWDIVKNFQNVTKLNWEKIQDNPIFKDYKSDEIKYFFENKTKLYQYRLELENEFAKNIDSSNLNIIVENLAENLVNWHNVGKINFKDFCGRRKELKDLFKKMDDTVEVHGVGGVGKTTLIHVALLLQILKGKKVVTIGKKQSYFSGSGYKYFKEKCIENLHEIIGDNISLNDVLEALDLINALKIQELDGKINTILKKINDENLIVFIDDFQFADVNVRELVKQSTGIVISSKSYSGIARNEVHLSGIEESERDSLIEIILIRLDRTISEIAKEKIKRIAEGHPVSTEILVRNSERINFDDLEDYKRDALDFSKPEHVQEFLKRVINDLFTNDIFELLKNLSIINTELEDNLDKSVIGRTFPKINLNKCFNEYLDTGILKKKEAQEGIYQFSFKHIQDSLREDIPDFHKKVVDYYKNKISIPSRKEISKKNDEVEMLFHEIKIKFDSNLLKKFIRISDGIKPEYYGYKRLIEIGRRIEPLIQNEEIPQFYSTLGLLYKELHWFDEAEKTLLISLDSLEKFVKKNRNKYSKGLGVVLNNLGNLYLNLHRYEEAKEAYLRSKNIMIRYPNRDPIRQISDLSGSFQNLGLCLCDLENYHESEEAYNSALSYVQKIPKKNWELIRDRRSKILMNIGVLYLNTKRYKNAETVIKTALNIEEELLGRHYEKYIEQHSRTLGTLANLYIEINKFHDAEKYYKKSLAISEKFAEKSPDAYLGNLGVGQNNLAIALMNIKKYQEAETCYQKSCDIYEILYKKNKVAHSPNYARFLSNFGTLYIEIKDFPQAIKLFEKSLNITNESNEQSSDAFLFDLSEVLHNFGLVHCELEDYNKSKFCFSKALDYRYKLFDKSSAAYRPGLTQTLNKYGKMLIKKGEYDQSETLLNDALESGRILVKNCSDAFLPLLSDVLNNNGVLYLELKQYEKSDTLLKESLEIREELANKNEEIYNQDVLETKKNIGRLFFEVKKYEESEKKLKEAYNIGHFLVEKYGSPFIPHLRDVLRYLEKLYDLSGNAEKQKEITEELTKIV